MNICTDIVLFKIIDKKLCVLILQRATSPFEGKRCLPGGFVQGEERIEETAIRVLKKETGITQATLEQIKVFSDPNRDPRKRSVGVAFLGIIRENIDIRPGEHQQNIMRCPMASLPPLAFDHTIVCKEVYKELIRRTEYDTYAHLFLQSNFTLRSLQETYEVLLNRTYEKRNFKKYISTRYKLKPTSKMLYGEAHRPSRLYKI